MGFRDTIALTKPGIILGNAITLFGGFLCASRPPLPGFDFLTLGAALLGMSLIIASACILNNHVDRDIDKLMQRTCHRPSVTGVFTAAQVFCLAAVTLVLGCVILLFGTNLLSLALSLLGYVFYTFIYTLWLKRSSIYGTLAGGISGAMPPVVGYTAVTGQFDLTALCLFLILFFWQIPHSYAIAVLRLEDYKAAKIPVLPVLRSFAYTRMTMLVYGVAMLGVIVLMAIGDLASWGFAGIAGLLTLYWIVLMLKLPVQISSGSGIEAQRNWARGIFLHSILLITVLSVALTI